MIRKYLMPNILHKVWDVNVKAVRHSALFVNRAKASEHFVYLIPHVDFPEKLQQKEYLQAQLNRRKSNYDFTKLENLWDVYGELKSRKEEYDNKKYEISRELGKLIKNGIDDDNTKKLKMQIDLLKDNIKKLKVPLWSAEENAIVQALCLPNDLHPQTPDRESAILYTHLSPPKMKKNHLTVGKELNIINFKKNENYYLKGDAAIFELGAKFYFNKLLKQYNCIQFSNPDFVKSLIIEGCGRNHTSPDYTFILHHNEDIKVNSDSRLHLTGGGSLYSFLAYHAKNVIHQKALPLKYFTMGRQYTPSPSDEDSLFHVSQSSVIEFFGATKNNQQLDEMLDTMIALLKTIYSDLGYHFRLCIVSADKLLMWESLRVAIEMYSTSLDTYVEVGNVSLSGDFISKRLMLTYVENKQNGFPHILSGTLLNVPKLLGCVLEQDEDFSLPDIFKVHNWSV